MKMLGTSTARRSLNSTLKINIITLPTGNEVYKFAVGIVRIIYTLNIISQKYYKK